MNDKVKKVVDFLFPITNTCNICGREIFDNGYFCKDCESKLTYNNGIVCNHCGRSVFNSEEYCFSCKGRETYFDKARSAFIYEDDIRKLIIALKYGGKRYLAEIFAKKLSLIYYQNFFDCDFVVFTPMTKDAKSERGYNQAELIAKEFCALTSLELKCDVVEKVKETQKQASLTDATERRKNLKGVFKVKNKKEVKGKNILLIDDVMTTGATVEYISEELKKAGANSVFVLTVASVSLGEEGKKQGKNTFKTENNSVEELDEKDYGNDDEIKNEDQCNEKDENCNDVCKDENVKEEKEQDIVLPSCEKDSLPVDENAAKNCNKEVNENFETASEPSYENRENSNDRTAKVVKRKIKRVFVKKKND